MSDVRDEETRDNASVWWDEQGERWVYRASGLGNCIGALVRMRMGVDGEEAPAWMQQRWDEGRDLEDEIIAWVQAETPWVVLTEDELRDRGLTVDTLGQPELEVKIPGGMVVKCHPDGVVRHRETGELAALEVKALSPDYAKTVRRSLPSFYAWQTSVEIAGLKKLGVTQVVFVSAEKEVAADDTDRDTVTLGNVEWHLLDPTYGTADIIKRVREVERLANDGDVPFCEFRQYPCAFWNDHDPDDPLWKEVVEEVDPEDELELHIALQEYEAMKQGEKECAEDKKRAAKVIAKFADDRGVHGGKLKTSQYIVTDVVQKRKGAVVIEQVFDELGLDRALLTEEVLDKCRGSYESRYPSVKKIKKD